jgi:hypothetical protein
MLLLMMLTVADNLTNRCLLTAARQQVSQRQQQQQQQQLQMCQEHALLLLPSPGYAANAACSCLQQQHALSSSGCSLHPIQALAQHHLKFKIPWHVGHPVCCRGC